MDRRKLFQHNVISLYDAASTGVIVASVLVHWDESSEQFYILHAIVIYAQILRFVWTLIHLIYIAVKLLPDGTKPYRRLHHTF